jgi:hypothetical protein
MRSYRWATGAAIAAVVAVFAGPSARVAHATLPPGNTVQQWDKIAEDTVVGSGAFQNESFVYMGYTTQAMYRAIAPGERKGQSADAAVIGAASTVLEHYFPSQSSAIDALRQEALAAVPDRQSKAVGLRYGDLVGQKEIDERAGDGLRTPIASTSTFPLLAPGAGVWRLAPPYAAPQTPWLGDVRPFIIPSADRFLPPPPPSLQSSDWVNAFNETKLHGSSTNPNVFETTTARFWTANVVRMYNGTARAVATEQGSNLVETARLMAMLNEIVADTGITLMHAKYVYLFWRPVTAIDPTSVTNDGFGPVPGFNDGNTATVEEAGWRPLIATPNHPEYPSAHCSVTAAAMAVLSNFLGTDMINVDIHGFDPAGPAGNLNAVRHFATSEDLRAQVANARIWGGIHFRFSTVAGDELGQQVAAYDLSHAFSGNGDQ